MILRLILTLLLLPGLAALAEDHIPTLAILRYGGTEGETTWSEFGVLHMLEAEGYISADERAQLAMRQNLEGENINVFFGDAGWDLATANLMVSDALGRGADALVTLTTPVTRAAANATAGMDDPPTALFASAFNPVEAGIMESACEKPANMTGSQIIAPYERALSLLMEQNAGLESVGIIHSTSEISGVAGAARLAELAEGAGLTVEVAAVVSLSDFPAAAQGLQGAGVDAIVAPIDALTAQALPVISQVANETGIPFLYPVLGAVYHGATFGIGFTDHYAQGLHLGRLAAAALDGSLDAANTAVRDFSGESYSVNLDIAAEQGIEIPQDLIDGADIVIQGSEATQSAAFQAAYAVDDIADLQTDEARAEAAAMIKSLNCEE